MKFLNFFKTTLGIAILILAVIAIIVIYLNWDTIIGWFSSDSGDLTQYNECNAAYAAMNDADLRAALTRDGGLDAGSLNNQTRAQLLVTAESICRTKFYPAAPGSQREKRCSYVREDGVVVFYDCPTASQREKRCSYVRADGVVVFYDCPDK